MVGLELPPASRTRIIRISFVIGSALLASRMYWTHSVLLTVCVGCGFGVLAFWSIPDAPNAILPRLATIGVAAAFGWSGTRGGGLSDPWQPFFAQDSGQLPLLLGRIGMFLALVLATERLATGERTTWLVLAAMFLLWSLFHRVMILPYVVVSLVGIGHAERVAPWGGNALVRALALAAPILALLSLWDLPKVRVREREPEDPASAVGWWLRRSNPHQARYRAVRWAKQEAVPGEGYLALARVNLVLGRSDRAQKTLTRLLARPASEPIRARAQAMQDALSQQVDPVNLESH